MSNEKPSSKVVLFPLCDPRGALSEVLSNSAESGTRLNALILAWRLELPEGVSISAAAEAMLDVAAANPQGEWTERQQKLKQELRRIGDSKGVRPKSEWQRLLKGGGSNSKSKQRKTRTERVISDTDS